jgi:valyl-tRNA synthetase
VDTSAERARLQKELGEAEAHAARLTNQLANETFRSKAPAHVIQGMETTLAETKERVAGLRERLGSL